ncbi:hypothetical protein GOP47_0011037 [Adiantum capillus-veneris]|uniref:Protein kinase domain-containing protein n=1 Tax=Adiantum capillus-veneris TaxID=13818 RepID=A0A9D4URZ5_ADICA|nr:hypothetical protein GOP47_0011037 [Adiantum capillus-veneris]
MMQQVKLCTSNDSRTRTQKDKMKLPLLGVVVWTLLCTARSKAQQAEYKPPFMYLLTCGAPFNSSITVDNRPWVSDVPSPYLSSTSKSISAYSNQSILTSPASPLAPLLSAARIFTTATSYSFPVSPGRYWVRLYFYPFAYQQFDPSMSVFSVTANSYSLFVNVNILGAIASDNYTSGYLFKEYSINVSGETLMLTFIPNSTELGYAYVNAIEVLSMPSNLFTDDTSPLGTNSPMPIGVPHAALETMHRVNVGGAALTPINDTKGLFRSWQANETFLLSPVGVESIDTDSILIKYETVPSMLIAPAIVYSTGLQTGFAALDLGLVQPGQNHAYYRDFSLRLSSGETKLWIQGAIQIVVRPSSTSKHKLGPIVGATVGGMAALLLIFVGIVFLKVSRTKRKHKSAWALSTHDELLSSKATASSHKSNSRALSVTPSTTIGRHFTLVEMLDATNNFDESQVIGCGGFGKVYFGELDDGVKVAVKRGSQESQQGIAEFETEINMLSKLRHRHLVSLIGHCDEQNEMILVYEYMARGTLRSHLYGPNVVPLAWKKRLEICIGAARGIHYLHTGAAQSIIHRDVKTTNILLDESFVAKMSDFGLSKTGPALDETHVSTAVKGSFGYLDPEYFRRQQLTEKSDVYSLGVVLLEVLCARPPINLGLSGDEVNLAEWAMLCKRRGKIENIVDPHVASTITLNCLAKFAETAEQCLADEGLSRPAIGDVLWNLEYALQLQEGSSEMVSMVELSPLVEGSTTRVGEGDGPNKGSEEEEEDGRAVFSQLVFPQGR